MRQSGAISINAVTAEGDVLGTKTVATAINIDGLVWQNYAWSALAVAVTVAVAWVFNAFTAHALGSVGMFFLVPVLLSAIRFGLRPALMTAFVSVMAYNFFFLPPLYTFTIADPNNWLSFAVLLLVAVTAANLASSVRAQANLAATRAAITGEMYQFTGKLAGIANLDDILWAAAFQIASMLKSNVVILLPDPKTGRLEIRVGYPPEDELDAQGSSPQPCGAGNEESRQAATRKPFPAQSVFFFRCGRGRDLSESSDCSTKTAAASSRPTKGAFWIRCSIRRRWR